MPEKLLMFALAFYSWRTTAASPSTPGTAGSLWNLARQAAQLYGRKMLL